MPDPCTVTRQNETTVIVTRAFDAPRAQVWRAFTEPALLTQWLLGPPGWEMHVCEVDLREGGGYRWRWRHSERGEFGFTGTYLKVIPMEHLEDTQLYNMGSHGVPMTDPKRNWVTFEDQGQGTRVISRMEFPTAEALTQALGTGMTEGMEMSYANLDRMIGEGVAG